MDHSALRDLATFFLDMDGTVYLGPNVIDGAADFIQYLKDSGRRYLFFTNNCSADAAYYSEKLAGMGITAKKTEILTSGEAMARYLVTETPYRRVFVLGTPSFEVELLSAGLMLEHEKPDAVVLAFDRTLTYSKLAHACHYLRQGLPYLATNPDLVCPTEYGYIPDCGSMAALLKASTGRDPKYIGKPHAEMVRMAMEKVAADAATTAMVGDRMYTDMQMAYDSGVASVLVLSGETGREDLESAPRKPDFIFESVRDLHAALVEADNKAEIARDAS